MGAATASVTTAGRAEDVSATQTCRRTGSQQEKSHRTRARGAGAWRSCSLPQQFLNQQKKKLQPNPEEISLCLHEDWPRSGKLLVAPNSRLADGHRKRLHRLSHNFCRLANSANSELAQMLSAGCLLCYSTSLCFWNYYHFKLHTGTKFTFPLLLTSGFAFKSILQGQPELKSISSPGFEPQSPFLSILHISITNCSESGKQTV